MGEFFAVQFQLVVDSVLLKWRGIRARFDETFTTKMADVANQPNWNGWPQTEYIPEELVRFFGGGLKGAVFHNMFYHLGLSVDSSPRGPVGLIARMNVLVIKVAMEKDQDFDLFVRSVLAGAKKLEWNFDREGFEKEVLHALEILLPH